MTCHLYNEPQWISVGRSIMRKFSKLYNYGNGIYECIYYKACSKQP